MAHMDTSLPVPDCFQESDIMTDIFSSSLDDFAPEFNFCHADLGDDLDISDLGVHKASDHDFIRSADLSPLCKQLRVAEPATSEHPSEHPSDVSSEGSGCFEVPASSSSPHDDDGASVLQQPEQPVTSATESPDRSDEHSPPEPGPSSKQQYVLVRLDASGNFMRHANDEDMHLLMQLLQVDRGSKMVTRSGKLKAGSTADSAVRAPSPVPHSGGQRKPGGPCCHCGATESPQWRRGPTNKPVLCNACGTRYRRTNQLGVAIPSYLKEKGRAASIASKKRALGA